MLRILTATSLLALTATPALAQSDMGANTQTTAPTQQMGAQPASPATPANPAQPSTDMGPTDPTMTTPATPAEPATPATPATDGSANATATTSAEPRSVTVQKLVDAEYPSYDANKNGTLDQAEFGKWVLALYAASGDAKAPQDAAAKDKWSKAAFATADTDKNKTISKAEMNVFLVG